MTTALGLLKYPDSKTVHLISTECCSCYFISHIHIVFPHCFYICLLIPLMHKICWINYTLKPLQPDMSRAMSVGFNSDSALKTPAHDRPPELKLTAYSNMIENVNHYIFCFRGLLDSIRHHDVPDWHAATLHGILLRPVLRCRRSHHLQESLPDVPRSVTHTNSLEMSSTNSTNYCKT